MVLYLSVGSIPIMNSYIMLMNEEHFSLVYIVTAHLCFFSSFSKLKVQ